MWDLPALGHRNPRAAAPRPFRRALAVAVWVASRLAASEEPSQLTVLHTFLADGSYPYASVTSDGAGMLYGTTYYGGAHACGTIYQVREDGGDYRVLYDFICGSGGQHPWAAPTLDGAGWLYGTTDSGGSENQGTIYRLEIANGSFAVLHSFAGGPSDGRRPWAQLLFDGAATLYGSTLEGGASYLGSNAGLLFKIQTDGSGYSAFFHFSGVDDAGRPQGRLLLNGSVLYGTAHSGGAADLGVLFRIGTDGTGFTPIRVFSGADGAHPLGDLVLVSGLFVELFGTTFGGGASGQGTVFRVRTNGADFTTLHHFAGGAGDGAQPLGGLARAGDGTLYGTTWLGGFWDRGALFRISPSGAGYQVTHFFAGGASDGRHPETGLVLHGGNAFGTTVYGGSDDHGTVFRIDLVDATFGLLKAFAPADGAFPGHLVRGEPGWLYGTTYAGGSLGRGTVFRVREDGTGYSVLRGLPFRPSWSIEFVPPDLLVGVLEYDPVISPFSWGFRMKTDNSDFQWLYLFPAELGWAPRAAPVYDGAEYLYGTMARGGAYDRGTLYRVRLDPFLVEQLHDFGSGADGTYPNDRPLVHATEGFLYGTTETGGAGAYGTLFKKQIDGPGYLILHDFEFGSPEGSSPRGSLALDRAGSLVGVTLFGGTPEAGVLFRSDRLGASFGVLREFAGAPDDAEHPLWEPLIGGGGELLGISRSGGAFDEGAIYRVAPDGSSVEILHSFASWTEPNRLVAVPGAVFGTERSGGPSRRGTIFRLPSADLFWDGFELGNTRAWSTTQP